MKAAMLGTGMQISANQGPDLRLENQANVRSVIPKARKSKVKQQK